MPLLSELKFDEHIPTADVYVRDEQSGEAGQLSRTAAIASAHARGLHLIARWPVDQPGPDDVTWCFVGRLTLPLRWEKTPAVPPLASVDERLWFEAPCGGRDYLLDGSGHTFVGRMSAWCPDSQQGYNVSLSEMGAMSDEARYFVRGFLSGTEPGPPADDDGAAPPADLDAWERAIFRFHSTGGWNDGWATCDVCGCVLLSGTWGSCCQEHNPPQPAAS